MASTKEYKIVINGLKESVSQVDALNKQLDALEKRMNDLQGKGINVGSVKVDSSSLKEQDNIQKQILSTEQKISDARDKEYQTVIKLKDELKQAKVEADGLAAASKLSENNYSNNTMAGLKEQLKDIKRVLNTTEIDSPMFKQLTEEANTITQKLKDIEQSYGVFSRSVGNYASAAEGFKGLKIQVGDVTREFDSAKEALKQLKNERDTLAMMGEDFHDIDIAVKQLQSSIKDLNASSSFMDNMLDTMQSIVAIASTAKGIGAVFGMDNDKIEETIKKLVALQNVLQGLETIQKQMQTGEGIGKWLATGNNAINKFSTGLFGAKKAVEGVAAAEKTATVASKAFGVALKGIGIGLIISLIASLVKHWDKINAAINKSIPSLEKFGGIIGWLEGLFNGLINVMSSTIEVLYKLIQGDFSGAWEAITNAWNSGFQEVVDDRIREERAAAAESLKIEMDLLEAKYGEEVKYTKKYQQLLAERNKLLKESYDPNTEEGKKALRELEVEQEREKKAYRDHAKEMAKLQKEADQELTNLRISNMKEGLNKQLTQLEEERKAKIAKIRENGRNVAELEKETNRFYDNEEIKKRNEYADKVRDAQQKLQDDLTNIMSQGLNRRLELMELEAERYISQYNDTKFAAVGNGWGSGWGRKEPNKIINSYGIQTGLSDKDLANMREYIRLMDEYNSFAEYGLADDEEAMKAKAEAAEIWNESLKKLGMTEEQVRYLAENANKNLRDTFIIRQTLLDDFYNTYIEDTMAYENALAEERKAVNDLEQQKEINALDDWRRKYNDTLTKSLEEGLITQEEYDSKTEDAKTEYYNQLEDIQRHYVEKSKQIDREFEENGKSSMEKVWNDTMQEYRDFTTAIGNIQQRTPVYNSWGIVNLGKTKDKTDELKSYYNTLLQSLMTKREKLNKDWDDGLISEEVYESTARELDRMTQDASDTLSEITDEAKQRFPQFMESIQQYIQAFGQTLTSVLEAVWAAQDAAYEREKEQLEKEAEEYEEMLQKQKEATEKYKDAVDSIEDELSTARGDRRQELIDQLNAQRAAQRESLKEEKRIEKEQEKIEEKKEKLELEQKKRQKQRDITTALINASLAVSYAAANHWPLPAIPLMAAAAIQGAAQVAAIKAQKYATGGIIEGKAHSHGGVKVLGGRAEVEGGEYIVNKRTTAKNAPLLSYINAKDKKIELEDIVEFYGSGVRRTIHAVSPQRKFAEGGVIPTLNNDITFNDRLLDSFEKYSNRPVVVSVVEIEDRMADVNSVRALAGLTE